MSIWDAGQWSDKVYRERLSPDEIQELGKALEDWAEAHPLANRPLLYLEQSLAAPPSAHQFAEGLTPRDLAHAVSHEESPLHQPVLRLFEIGLSGYSGGRREAVAQVIEALMEDVGEWEAGGG